MSCGKSCCPLQQFPYTHLGPFLRNPPLTKNKKLEPHFSREKPHTPTSWCANRRPKAHRPPVHRRPNMRRQNPTTPWRSSSGALGSFAFIDSPLPRESLRLRGPSPRLPGMRCYKMCAFATTMHPQCSTMYHQPLRTERTHLPFWQSRAPTHPLPLKRSATYSTHSTPPPCKPPPASGN